MLSGANQLGPVYGAQKKGANNNPISIIGAPQEVTGTSKNLN